MTQKLQPTSVNGIEFDALISASDHYEQEIPDYPTEEGFSVSDTIILRPRTLSMTVYLSNAPVTWANRHAVSTGRCNEVQNLLEDLYFSKELVTVKTSDAIYYNMGMTSLDIAKDNSSYRTVTFSFKEVYVTERRTAQIPGYSLKSGATKANAGKAAASSNSGAGSGVGTGTGSGTGASTGSAGGMNSGAGSSGASESKKAGSILYGAASGMGFL